MCVELHPNLYLIQSPLRKCKINAATNGSKNAKRFKQIKFTFQGKRDIKWDWTKFYLLLVVNRKLFVFTVLAKHRTSLYSL